jgi:hypothetical protein
MSDFELVVAAVQQVAEELSALKKVQLRMEERQSRLEESMSLHDVSAIQHEKTSAKDSFTKEEEEDESSLRARDRLSEFKLCEDEDDDLVKKIGKTQRKSCIGRLTEKFKFNGREDFDVWKIKIYSYLRQFDAEKLLKKDLSRKFPEEDAAVVHYLSCCCVGNAAKVLTIRKNIESAYRAWSALEARYGITGDRKIESLETRWEMLKMDQNETGIEFVDRLLDLCIEFETEGVTKTERLRVRKLYMCLSDEYESVKTAISSDDSGSGLHRWVKMIQYIDQERADREKRSFVAKAMLAESKKETAKGESSGDAQKSITCFRCKEKGHKSYECPKRTCHICKKVGHIAKDCKSKEVGKAKVAKNVTISNSCKFVVDSGAYPTLVPTSMDLSNIRDGTVGKIEIANGDMISVSHAGDVALPGLGKITVNASDCVGESLLSVSQCARELNLSVVFDEDSVRFVDGKIDVEQRKVKGRGRLEGDVYVYVPSEDENAIGTAFGGKLKKEGQAAVEPTEEVAEKKMKQAAKTRKYQQLNAEARLKWITWHRIFGHANAMSRTLKKSEGFGLPQKILKKDDCMDCIKAKQKRESFVTPKREHVTYLIGESIHIDTWDATVKSIWDEEYWITIKEEISGMLFGEPMKKKSDCGDIIIQKIAYIQRQTGNKVKVIHCDNAKEFIGPKSTLGSFCREKGIEIRPSIRYTPEMNSVAENANQIQANMAQAMRFCAKLPESFWSETMRHAVWVLNVVVHKESDASPYKKFFGREFDYNQLHPFGCHVFVHIPKKYRGGKLKSKSCPGIYLGISNCQRGHKIFDVERRVVFVAHSVIFDDANFGIRELKERINVLDIDLEGLEDVEDDGELENFHEVAEDKMIDIEAEIPSSMMEQDEEDDDEVIYNDDEIRKLKEIDEKRPKREVKSTRQIDFIYGRAKVARKAPHADDSNMMLTPKSYNQAKNCADGAKWDDAMKRELNALKTLNTYELVPRPEGKHVHQGVWNYRIKTQEGKVSLFKARSCVDGSVSDFEKKDTFSPVAMSESIYLLIVLAVMNDLPLYNGDIPTAYVRANIPDDVEVYVEQPKGYEEKDREKFVWKLRRALYGLPISGALWNKALDQKLKALDFEPSAVDPCLYYKSTKSGKMYLTIVVDDILVLPPTVEEYQKFCAEMKETFEYKDLGVCEWFLGIKFQQSPMGIFIFQGEPLKDVLHEFKRENLHSYDTPMEAGLVLQPNGEATTTFPFRSVCGKLRYLTKTRPDIEYALNQCCRVQCNPGDTHVKAITRLLGYLKKNVDLGILFKKDDSNQSKMMEVVAYADSSFADEKESRKSTFGFIIFINGNPIFWKSGLSAIVAQSCAEAEYIALCQCSKEMSFVANLVESIGMCVKKPMVIYSDSESAIAIAKGKSLSPKSKHIEVRFYYVRDKIVSGEISIEKVSTDENIADMFTKSLGRVKFQKHRNVIMDERCF